MLISRMVPKLLVFLLGLTLVFAFQKYPLLMPNVRPTVDELYLCTPVRVNYSRNYYIVGFEPQASKDVVHHMLLYGCSEPGASVPTWNCGEMWTSSYENVGPTYPPCKNGSQIIYAWARNAPKLDLPTDVGFKVGGDSPIKYLVLQVHYAHSLHGRMDSSGVDLVYTDMTMPKLAGVLLLGTAGVIRAKSVEHMETSCTINEDKELHPFAFRTHTHQLGKVVSGFRVRNDTNGKNVWKILGKKDPLLPEMFYPVFDSDMTIKKGDIMAARCTMKSDRLFPTFIGPTNLDEMCNFYLMYWVEGDEPLNMKYCFSPGPPDYYWSTNGLDNIPEREASSLD